MHPYRFLILPLLAAVALGCPESDRESAELTPMPGGGYALSGPHDLDGALTFENGAWTLDATFTFPTGGYRVAEPDVIVAESFPEQVTIELTVFAPSPSAIVTQALQEQTVTTTIQVSEEADFTVYVVTTQQL